MTIAVAALFPWGRIRESWVAARLEQAVILASDSRFTLSGGKVDDDGRKIYPLSRDAVAVYAGDVLAAQRGISDVKAFLLRRPSACSEDAAKSAGLLLRMAYSQESLRARRKERMPLGPLHVLVGVCRPEGRAGIVRYSSPKFAPLYVWGVDAVDWPEDISTFRRVLEEMQRQRCDPAFEGMSLEPDPAKWRNDVVLGVRGALESRNRSQTIGGRIQSVIVTRRGWSEEGITWVKRGCDPMLAESWEELTTPVDATRAYRRSKASAQPVAESGLVYAHIAD